MATLMLGGLTGAVEAATSYHGDDYSYDFPGHDPQGNVGTGIYGLSTCDREGDGNWVGARWRYAMNGSDKVTVNDTNGANGDCNSTMTQIDMTSGYHRTGEKNFVWSFGNWTQVK